MLEKLKVSSTRILVVKINVVLFFCFPSHNQNERNVRDMASYDIKAVMLDNHVEGSLGQRQFPPSSRKTANGRQGGWGFDQWPFSVEEVGFLF